MPETGGKEKGIQSKKKRARDGKTRTHTAHAEHNMNILTIFWHDTTFVMKENSTVLGAHAQAK